MNETTEITTDEYHIRYSRYFTLLCSEIIRDWWNVALLLAAALTIAACYDLRYGIVLLLVVFVIIPMLLFFVFYHYALLPECLYSVTPKSLVIDKQGIDCMAYETRRHILKWSDVKRMTTTREACLLYTGRYTFFYLPYEAFATPAERQRFFDEMVPAALRIPDDKQPE